MLHVGTAQGYNVAQCLSAVHTQSRLEQGLLDDLMAAIIGGETGYGSRRGVVAKTVPHYRCRSRARIGQRFSGGWDGRLWDTVRGTGSRRATRAATPRPTGRRGLPPLAYG